MDKTFITVLPGDGIGPSIMGAAIEVLDQVGCNFNYEYADAGLTALEKSNELLPEKTVQAIKRNRVVLKGPLTTPIGEGFSSINVALRQKFKLYANIRPAISFEGTRSRYQNIDIVTVRENTEGMYSGRGQSVSDDDTVAEALSVITRGGAERILRAAFELARREKRRKVTVVHKANILKSTSGLFLRIAREVASDFDEIKFEEMIVDNACMQLVMNPQQFDVIVTTNLFGDILSDLCAGLVGGLGMAPGANIGDDIAIFEAVHGSAPDIAGMDVANPTSVILASCMMLDYLGLKDKAARIRAALREQIASGESLTRDLGGEAGTQEFTRALIARL